MNTDHELTRAFDRYTDAIMDYVGKKVENALELERDRIDAELLELRDLVADAALRTATTPANEEYELLNRRMTKLTETVSRLMETIGLEEEAGYSVKVPDE